MPLLDGVSAEDVFFDEATISLADGTLTPQEEDADWVPRFARYTETRFPDGYRVGLIGVGRHRQVADGSAYAVGVLSPDRSTIFDTSVWPSPAVAYDAATGDQRRIDAPWEHFSLVIPSSTDLESYSPALVMEGRMAEY